MKSLLLCLLNTALLVAGQLLFKYGANDKKIENLGDIFKLVFNPVIILALFLYAGTTLLWLYILSSTPISYAYPIQALAFPLVLIISSFIFNEHISIFRWLGVLIIVIGVFVSTKFG